MGAVHRLGTVVVLSLAAACGPAIIDGDDGGRPSTGGNGGATDSSNLPLVELGTGADGFHPVADGDQLPLVMGPQGGYHIWAAVRVRAPINPKNLTMNFRLILDGAEVSNNTWKFTLSQNGSTWEWYAGTEIVDDPMAVSGKEVEYRVEVVDVDGRKGSDSRRVIVTGP